ncbi:MAG: hypothetical protein QOD89_2230 [Bradyrhizobium sp.]|jgi:hypothetical protein|nr:hypothetical protein [Bradyrhizobium sp.]
MGYFWKLFYDNWAVIMTAPFLFVAALSFGWLAGWITVRLFYNQRLAHQGDMIINLRAILEEKLPASFLPPPPRKRSKQMSFGLILIFVGVGSVLVGALIVALEKPERPAKTLTASGSIPPAALPLENPIPTSPTIPPVVSETRQFTDRTPSELMTLYEGRTPFQAETLIQPYKGKWIKVRGKVINLLADSSEPGASIAVIKDGNAIIECRLSGTWKDKVAKLSNGDTLHVAGRINPFQNGSQLYLQQCEII